MEILQYIHEIAEDIFFIGIWIVIFLTVIRQNKQQKAMRYIIEALEALNDNNKDKDSFPDDEIISENENIKPKK